MVSTYDRGWATLFARFSCFLPPTPYPYDNDALARLSKLWVTMTDNQTIEAMPNKLAIALKLNGEYDRELLSSLLWQFLHLLVLF